MKVPVIFAAAFLAATTAFAQLAPPNGFGVTVGHIHLAVKDVDAQKRFFTEAFGGTVVQKRHALAHPVSGRLHHASPGRADGPPAGSIVNHFGFVVKDLPAMMAKWKAMGVK